MRERPNPQAPANWVCRGLLAAACVCAAAEAQESAPTTAPASGLRAEISAARSLFSPGEKVVLRFTLINSGDEVVELPLRSDPGAAEGVALPASLIFGDAAHPALFLSFDDEAAAAISHPAPASQPARESLRIAPHGSVGAELDMRMLYRRLRYAGRYRVDWKPASAAGASAVFTFRVEPRKRAVLVTDYGKISFDLLYDKAPHNVDNLLELIGQRFYDGLKLHRVIPEFIIQGGSPTGKSDGVRPDGKHLQAEWNDTPFDAGTLAMATKPGEPHSASCQFFITLARLADFDGKYTAVGQARDDESLATLRKIAELPTDAHDAPRHPVVIRMFMLIDAAERGPDRLDVAKQP